MCIVWVSPYCLRMYWCLSFVIHTSKKPKKPSHVPQPRLPSKPLIAPCTSIASGPPRFALDPRQRLFFLANPLCHQPTSQLTNPPRSTLLSPSLLLPTSSVHLYRCRHPPIGLHFHPTLPSFHSHTLTITKGQAQECYGHMYSMYSIFD